MSTLKVNTINTIDGSGNITFSRPTVLTAGDIVTADILDLNVTTAKIANDAVTGAKLNPSLVAGDIIYADGTDTITRLAKGTAAQILKMNSGATAPEWAAAGGGGAMTYISSVSASNDASADFLSSFSATYDDYIVRFNSYVPVTDGKDLRVRIAVGGVAQTGSTDYDYAVKGGDDQGVLQSNHTGGGDSHLRMQSNGTGNSTGECSSGEIKFLGVNNTSLYKMTTSHMSYFNSTPVFVFTVAGGQYNGSTTAWSGCQFFSASGNMAGDFHLYGVKKA